MSRRGPVLALFREALWIRAALAVVAFSVACLFLGRWQFHRHQAKVARADRVVANYDAAPVPLPALLGSPGRALPARDEWRRVLVSGRYEPGGTLLVRNRPLDGVFGFEVLVPFRLADGAALLVDRGWIPFGPAAGRAGPVPEPPAGEVQVVARLRRPEPAGDGTGRGRTVARISVEQLRERVDGALYGGYALMAQESPAAPKRPAPLPRPDTDLGPHLAYAVQWWTFGLVGYLLLAVYARRELERRAEGGRPAEGARPARSRGRDEQIEDEQVDRGLRAAAGRPGPAAPRRSER